MTKGRFYEKSPSSSMRVLPSPGHQLPKASQLAAVLLENSAPDTLSRRAPAFLPSVRDPSSGTERIVTTGRHNLLALFSLLVLARQQVPTECN